MASQIAPTFLFVGTYTWMQPYPRGRAAGIYVYRMDPETGALTLVHTQPDVINPTYLTVDTRGEYLYAVNAVAAMDGVPGGALNAFSIDRKTGSLTFLNRESTHGDGPCFVSVDRGRRLALTSNYHGGSIAAFPVLADGRLAPASTFIQHHGSSVVPSRQAAPHAHSINYTPDERFAVVCDLGLDRVMVYAVDFSTGKLTLVESASAMARPGDGPRHFAFHPNGRIAFSINELSNTITSFHFDAVNGSLRPIESVPTLPAGWSGESSTADIHVAPSGRFVYGSNRGHDSIVIYAVDPESGHLTYCGNQSTLGKVPRNFVIDPTGRLLLAANSESDTIVVFHVDQNTGLLTETSQIACPSAVCLKIMTMG